jgi:hypothetical protein
MKLGHD